MSKHTQEEWHNIGLEIRNKSGMILANVYKHLESNQSKEEALFIAKLMASAPDLLEACEYALNRIVFLEQYVGDKVDPSKLNLLRSAIKKATK